MLNAQNLIKNYLKVVRPDVLKFAKAAEKFEPKIVGGTVRLAFFKPELFTDKLLPTDVDVVINRPA